MTLQDSLVVDSSWSVERLPALEALVADAIAQAANLEALAQCKHQWLGRQGQLTLLKRQLKHLSAEQRPAFGQALNDVTTRLDVLLAERQTQLDAQALADTLAKQRLDVTLPGLSQPVGKPHPLTALSDDVCRLFEGMGYTVLDDNACPEVETDHYNFVALNFKEDHPARDMQDTFYTTLAPNVLLRSQTSNAQIRYMEHNKPPLRIVAPGRVYRNEEVSSRKFVLFHQIEGLYVDSNVRFSDLKGTLNAFIAQLFGGQPRRTRFRPSYFPFTEPSAEVDVECVFCQGKGCKVCSHSGWLEILGAGMVHPNVLRHVGIDPDVYSGFAFGMGVERLAMLRDGIEDIRLFYQNDQRLLTAWKAGGL
jgi:phenylalanyl-tRNA synthetase alpha chain